MLGGSLVRRLVESGPWEVETEVSFPAEILSLQPHGDTVYLVTAEPALYSFDRRARVRRLGDLPRPMRLVEHGGRLLLGDEDGYYLLDVENLWGTAWSIGDS